MNKFENDTIENYFDENEQLKFFSQIYKEFFLFEQIKANSKLINMMMKFQCICSIIVFTLSSLAALSSIINPNTNRNQEQIVNFVTTILVVFSDSIIIRQVNIQPKFTHLLFFMKQFSIIISLTISIITIHQSLFEPEYKDSVQQQEYLLLMYTITQQTAFIFSITSNYIRFILVIQFLIIALDLYIQSKMRIAIFISQSINLIITFLSCLFLSKGISYAISERQFRCNVAQNCFHDIRNQITTSVFITEELKTYHKQEIIQDDIADNYSQQVCLLESQMKYINEQFNQLYKGELIFNNLYKLNFKHIQSKEFIYLLSQQINIIFQNRNIDVTFSESQLNELQMDLDLILIIILILVKDTNSKNINFDIKMGLTNDALMSITFDKDQFNSIEKEFNNNFLIQNILGLINLFDDLITIKFEGNIIYLIFLCKNENNKKLRQESIMETLQLPRRNSTYLIDILNQKYHDKETNLVKMYETNQIDIKEFINKNKIYKQETLTINNLENDNFNNKKSIEIDTKMLKNENEEGKVQNDQNLEPPELKTKICKYINCDDENGIINMNKRLFKKQGIELDSVKTGDELISYLNLKIIDSKIQQTINIIMDYSLENEQGDEVLEKVNQWLRDNKPKILLQYQALTSTEDEVVHNKFIKSGVTKIYLKPLKKLDLIEMIN